MSTDAQSILPVVLGLKPYEWLTLIGVVTGPIVAVAITLWIEGRRRRRDQQVNTMRMLLNTRHLPSDPAYTVAINTVPIEFNGRPKVMNAWKTYIDAVRFTPTEQNAEAHYADVRIKQTKLIFEIMQDLGFELSETDIQNSAYAAGGFIERDNLSVEGWRAWKRIADALELQTQFLTVQAEEGGEK